ncbi:MAG: hypothetical protein AAGI44_02375 [Pseudomonadota bacterium]
MARHTAFVIIGNSHIGDLFYTLERYYRDTEVSFPQLGLTGCPGRPGLESKRLGRHWCRGEVDNLVDYAARAEGLCIVYLMIKGPNYLLTCYEPARFLLLFGDNPRPSRLSSGTGRRSATYTP